MIQQLLFQSSFCFGTVTFFGAATYGTITSFLQLFFFFRRPSFSERNFYRAPTSWEKKIGSFREANLLKDHKGLGGLSCSDKRHMQKSYFFEAVTSTWHEICLNSCVLAYPKSGTKEPGLLMGPKTRDPKTIS